MKTLLSQFVLICFLMTNIIDQMPVCAQEELSLPMPGVMVSLSPQYDPPVLKGIKLNPNNPFRLDFILDVGDGSKPSQQESTKLIKYFLASLTIPEEDLWVNLSPYEKNRIVPQSFGLTEMGRDLLAQDYMLKQITASLIYPEDAIGKRFWKRIYEQAAKQYGTTNIPVNTFNKVWIMPEKAIVYENAKAGTAYVVESKLKVMLEEDYLALNKNVVGVGSKPTQERVGYEPAPTDVNQLGFQVVREIVIPELTKEINENKNFAQLRQVYSSLILATWYKKKLKDSILAQVYADKRKIVGVGYGKSDVKQIYQRYLEAFKKGVYNYIKEEQDPITAKTLPKKYFSGGETFMKIDKALIVTSDPAQVTNIPNDHKRNFVVQTDLNIIKDKAMNGSLGEFDLDNLKITFKKLIPKLNKKNVYYNSDFLWILNDLLTLIEEQNTHLDMSYVQDFRMPLLFYFLADQNEYLTRELLADLISDLSTFMVDELASGLTINIGTAQEYTPSRKTKRKISEDYLKNVFAGDIELVHLLAADEMQRVREEKERIQHERLLQAQRDRREREFADMIRKTLNSRPLDITDSGQPPAALQPRPEKIKAPIKDKLDDLLQNWDREHGLRIMARKSKDLESLLKLLSSVTMLHYETVEERFIQFANAQRMSQQTFFKNLSSERIKTPQSLPKTDRTPEPEMNPVSIQLYKNPAYFNTREWEKHKNEAVSLLNKLFSDEHLQPTTQTKMYRWAPGIYRFKIDKERYSIYARYYEEEKRLLIFGFNTQSTFHGKDERLHDSFIRFLEGFDAFILNEARSSNFEQIQDIDPAMMTRREMIGASAAFAFIQSLHAEGQHSINLLGAPATDFNQFIGIMNKTADTIEAELKKGILPWGIIQGYQKQVNDYIKRIRASKRYADLRQALSMINNKLKTEPIDTIAIDIAPEELITFNRDVRSIKNNFKVWGIRIDDLDDLILYEFGPVFFLQYKGKLGPTKLAGIGDMKLREHIAALMNTYMKSYLRLISSIPSDRQNSFKKEFDQILKDIAISPNFVPPSGKIVDQLLNKYNVTDHELVDQVIGKCINFIKASIGEQNKDFVGQIMRLYGNILVYTTTLRVKDLKQLLEENGRQVQSQEEIWPSDQAMLIVNRAGRLPGENREGGIDLTSANMNLQTKVDGITTGMTFHLDPGMLQQLQNVRGFEPVIINIQPMTDLQMFLGLNKTTDIPAT